MECELCGKHLNNIRKAKIEGSILTVCDSCIKYGKEVSFSVKQEFKKSIPAVSNFKEVEESIQKEFSIKPIKKLKTPYVKEIFEEFELVENYAQLIQQARQKRNMRQEEFAKFLNERESVIKKLETGKIVPDEKLVRKLEKMLEIKLRENSESEV